MEDVKTAPKKEHPMTRRCAYCGAKTGVLPLHGMRSSQFSRATHSPLKAKFPPICAAVQQGIAATRRAKIAA